MVNIGKGLDVREEFPQGKRITFGQWRKLHEIDNKKINRADLNIGVAVEITGSLDVERFKQAIISSVYRHAILRTTYRRTDHGYELAEQMPFRYPETLDFSDELDDRGRCREYAQSERMSEIDIWNECPCRAIVVKLKASYILLWYVHHLAFDGRSAELLLREVFRYYDGLVDQRENAAPFESFAVAQHDYITTPYYKRDVEYWIDELRGLPLKAGWLVPLPECSLIERDVYHPNISSMEAREFAKILSKRNYSLFEGVLACYYIGLSNTLGCYDLPIGVAISNRMSVEFRNTVGFLSDSHIVRMHETSGSIHEVLRLTRLKNRKMLRHHRAPFCLLMRDRHEENGWDYPQIFQARISMEPQDFRHLTIGDCDAKVLDWLPITGSSRPINLYVFVDGGTPRFEFVIRKAFLKSADALRLIQSFECSLRTVLEGSASI